MNTTFFTSNDCPDCKEKGYKVSVQTLFSHVNDISKVDKDKIYWVCKNPVCDTVYFGSSYFYTYDVNKEFGLKEGSSIEAKLCYGFNYSKKQYLKIVFMILKIKWLNLDVSVI